MNKSPPLWPHSVAETTSSRIPLTSSEIGSIRVSDGAAETGGTNEGATGGSRGPPKKPLQRAVPLLCHHPALPPANRHCHHRLRWHCMHAPGNRSGCLVSRLDRARCAHFILYAYVYFETSFICI